ncbi:cysteine desulfurase family protein [Seleniivibrio woodruffii]|uniref:cysteine desulfurase n=1 Tax=Seleniivibrio woodruffii TaxID=1078050 RepID=A0A4R1KC96_9BACT|nr:cysteine desulfurase family protein [Seleniivibrio woodruffii]TCK62166.1 cysteine desulfurase [Seleniivibrio woodruffii]TVZ34717.1 cysteine desulfurase [Seleniivibrio woodruffii]
MSIYLDYSATTPVDPKVFEAMIPYFKEKFANPSSIHTLGRIVREDVDKARATVAKSIGAEPHEIIFTASGTSSDNMAIRSIAEKFAHRGKHIITSVIEHKAVLQTCKYLEKHGYEVTYLPVDKDGLVSVEDFRNAIRKDTILVSIMLVNNEIGTLQPIKEISAIARKNQIIVHTDAVQAMGKMKIDVGELGVDLLTFSGHKICAPKGIGVLYVDENLKDDMVPLIFGGSQEFGLRAGTENVANIIGLAKACEIVMEDVEKEAAYVKGLRDLFENRILTEIPQTYVNGSREKRVCSVTNIAFKFIEAEALMIYAEEICCSTGSACTSESVDASHVLYAIGVDPVDLHGSIRFSFGRFNTEEEVNRAVEMIKTSVEKLRAMSPLV